MNEISPKQNDSELTTSSEDDFNLIERALLQNPRGRWFLEEYVNRQRPEDTKKLLGAIQRIEKNLTKQTAVEEDDIDPIRMSIIEMSKAIAKTRQEIKSIKPANESEDQIINATGELSAIVESTETATNIILEAAEEIQEATWILREAGADEGPCSKIEDKTTDIYTACSFQDITGQRTTKVVQALSYIENRVNAMIDIWGLHDLVDGEVPIGGDVDVRPDAHLLHGPSADGEGVEQIDIDDISFDAISSSPAEAIDPNDISFDTIEVVSDEVDTATEVNEEISSEVSIEEASIGEVSLDKVSVDHVVVEEAELQVPDETSVPETEDAMEAPVELTAETALNVIAEDSVDLSVEAAENTAEVVEDTAEVLESATLVMEAPEVALEASEIALEDSAVAALEDDPTVDLGDTAETSEDMAVEATDETVAETSEGSLVDEIGEVEISSDDMNIEASIDEVGSAVAELDVDGSVDFPAEESVDIMQAEENAVEVLASPEMESPVDMMGAIEDEVAVDETATVVDSNEDDGVINLGDIEVTDLDIVAAVGPSEDVIDPPLDAPSIDMELDATQEQKEELSMGEIETQVADTPDPMTVSVATNMIASPEEFEVIEEIDVDALSDNQKDMILN